MNEHAMRADRSVRGRAGAKGVVRRAATLGAIVTTTASVVVASLGGGGSAAAPRLVPQPTTTVTPRATTTVPRSTTTLRPRPTTTMAPTTTAPPTTAVAATTIPTTPPTSTSVASTSTTVTPPTVSSTTATTQPVAEPPTSPSTNPPSSAPVAEPFVYSFPVVVDPEDPALQPPVIIGASTWCQASFDEGQIGIAVQNVDAYHYPPPFAATYEWTLSDGADVTSSGTIELAGWETHTVHLSTVLVGPRTFTVTDVALGTSATVDIDVPDCVNAPPPVVPDPLGPVVVIASVECSEDINATSGTGTFHVHIQNPPGDDSSDRQYDIEVLLAQVSVWSHTTAPLFDGSWGDEKAAFFHSGSYMVTVADHDDPALAAAVAVDVPECAPAPPPPAEPAPPNAPLIIDVATTCADPVLQDGRADFVRLNPNWQFLGGPGELTYDWSVVTGTTVVQSFQGWFNTSGVYTSFLQPLAPGEYTASINAAGFPALGNSVTFTIEDCTVQPQPDPTPLAIYGVTTVCLPGDATQSAVWVVEQHGTVQPAWFEWMIRDDAMLLVDGDSPVTILDDQPVPLSSRALPLGTMHLTVTGNADPSVTASATFEIGPCADPVDPTDPTDPTDTSDPSDPTDPSGPTTSTTDPTAPTTPTEPIEPTDAAGTTTPPNGLLPATR